MTNLLQHARRGFVWPFPTDDSVYAGGGLYFGSNSSGYAPDQEQIPAGFTEMVNGPFRSNAIVFACELKRVSVFSQANLMWQGRTKGRPGPLFSEPSLDILRTPWPRGTTADLLANMLLSADIGGNAFVARTAEQPDRLRVLRPDYMTIVMGDESGRPVEYASQLDAEIIGFIYDPKDGGDSEALLAEEVALWPPMPDPLARFRGMSWLTPVIREIQADQSATMHKLTFFKNGATPQLVVSMDATVSPDSFEKFVAKMDQGHSGWRNAYKTLYLGGGATPTVVGKDLQQLDFSNTQGKGETRIIAAAGLSPILLPASEGLAGSSLNAGNYSAARRSVGDTTFRWLWQGACGALAQIVQPARDPSARLWYDEANIPFLQEDAQDAATIISTQAATITNLVKEGFTPISAVAGVTSGDLSNLKHTGLPSVQLQPVTNPVEQTPAVAANGNGGSPS